MKSGGKSGGRPVTGGRWKRGRKSQGKVKEEYVEEKHRGNVCDT